MEVSVIIPVYNAVDYINQSIRSALIQPEVQEVIVIDDGSTDGSYERLEEWEDKEPRIKLLFHPNRERKRAAATRNLGLQNVKSEWVAFLDADDTFLPNRFYYTKQTINSYPEANVIYEAVQIIRENGSRHEEPKDNLLMMDDLYLDNLFERYLTSQGGDICPNGLVMKRSLLDIVGYMDESLKQKHDKDYILRLCLHGRLCKGLGGKKPVAIYRYHSSNTILNTKERKLAQRQLHEKWIESLSSLPLSIYGKLKFVRHFLVSKYNTSDWSIASKICLYPFLYIYLLLKIPGLFNAIFISRNKPDTL